MSLCKEKNANRNQGIKNCFDENNDLLEDNNENYLLQEERTFQDEEDCQEENRFQEVRSTLNQKD